MTNNGGLMNPAPLSFAASNAPDTTGPVMNGSLTASNVTHEGFVLTWQAASDAVGVTGYRVSINGGADYESVGLVLTRAITGRQPSTAHLCRVLAEDAAGNLSAPLSLNVMTTAAPDTAPPVMSGSISVTNVSQSGFTFSVPAGSDNVGVVGYESSIDGGGSWQEMGMTRARTVSSVAAGTTFALLFRCYDAAGLRSQPLVATVTTDSAVIVADYVPSNARTLIATTDSARPFTPAIGGYWNTVDAKKPYGPMDPNSKIDFSIDWSPVLADMGELTKIATAEFFPPPGLAVLAGSEKITAGTKQSGVFQVTAPPGGNNTKVPVLYRITATGEPGRVLDRTFYLNIEET